MAVFLLVAMFGLIRVLRADYAAAGIPKPQALTGPGKDNKAEAGNRDSS